MTDAQSDFFELRLIIEVKSTSMYNLDWMISAIERGLIDGERIVDYAFNETNWPDPPRQPPLSPSKKSLTDHREN